MTTPPPRVEASDALVEAFLQETTGEADRVDFAAVLPSLAEDVRAIDQVLQGAIRASYPQLTDAASYACGSGGKRVRPLLMAAAHRALGAESTVPVHALAAAFQLIHTASLVHDDVIDHATLRRGNPSLPRAFGLPSAIVTGDYLFIRAFELAADYPRSIILRCGESCADLAEGEILQENARFDLSVDREHYFRIVERKTAAIVAAGLASVAEIAGAAPPVVEGLAEYGRTLGIAFQVRDDYLDVYGDPVTLGKPLYNDYREGNPTLLSLEAYGALTGHDRDEFERLFQKERKATRDLLRLKELTDSSGAGPRVADEALEWSNRATRSLEALPAGPYRSLLAHVALGVARRRF
jgi:octaprenyl-diphosphate synthase